MNAVEKKLAELNGTQGYLYKKEVNRRIRMRYDYDDEIALSRQREEKPEEWKAYYEYCEQCKKEAREEVYA